MIAESDYIELNGYYYKQALISNEIAIWRYSLENYSTCVSENWVDIAKYSLNKNENMIEFINRISLDEDKLGAVNDFVFYLEGKADRYCSTFRINSDIGHRWILLKGKKLLDSMGKTSIIGSAIDITEYKNKENEMKKIAYYDSLTGIPNRTYFINKLKKAIDGCIQKTQSGAVIFLDIDNFKSVNDTYGHQYGDLLLKIFAKLLSALINEYGELFRLGGDEFVILIKKYSKVSDINELCDRILGYCRTPFEVNEQNIYITTSIGISIFPKDGHSVDELLKYSDLAMYKSKERGKNVYTFFEKYISEGKSRETIIEQELKKAIKNNELYVAYQPQIDIYNHKVVGLEALLRWDNEKLGNVSPIEFIPIAEKTGIIIDIGNFVIDRVCKKIRHLIDENYYFNSVSINMSPIQIEKTDFKSYIFNACKENKIPLKVIGIEITEESIMRVNRDKIKELSELVSKGVNVSIDDFGKGYSSLYYLTELPINTLKIDKSFIDNIYDERNMAVIDCILNLSKSLKYTVIAEGVETERQLQILSNVGCDIIQGYYFSRPVNENMLEEKLDSIKERC